MTTVSPTLRPIRPCRSARMLAACLPLAAALLLGTSGASAQTEEEIAGARAAATEGVKAFKEERWQDAVDLFGRAESLVHAPTHLLYMARAQVNLGRYVKARELYNKIIRDKIDDDAPPAFKQAQDAAAEEIKAVEPKLARLTIKVEGGEGVQAQVTMDGRPVPAAVLGVPYPVDPGKHTLEAVAEGYRAQPQQVDLQEGGRGSVTLVMQVDATARPAAAPGPAALPESAAAPEQDQGVSEGTDLSIPAYAALGVGAIGVGLGVVFTLQSAGKRSDADDKHAECEQAGGGTCIDGSDLSQQVASLDDEARSAQTLAIVGYAVGGVGIVAGVTMLLLSDSGEQQAAAEPRLSPFIGIGSIGLRGTF